MMHDRNIDSDRFRKVLGHYPTGISVVTAITDGEPFGMVVGTFTSVSLDPPLVAFMPAKSSSSWPQIEASGKFCANVLSADQADLCKNFSRKGGNKFEGIDYTLSPSGSPVLDQVVAWVDCEIYDVVESGDHYIVIGRVLDLDIVKSEAALAFYRGEFGRFSPPSQKDHPAYAPSLVEKAAAIFMEHELPHDKARHISSLSESSKWQSDAMFIPRQEIVREILAEYLRTILVKYQRVVSRKAGSRETLEQLITVMFSAVEEHRAAGAMYVNERVHIDAQANPEIPRLEHEMRVLWESVLSEGTERGVFRTDLNRTMVYYLIRDAAFVVARWHKQDGPYSVEDLCQQYTKVLIGGVLAPAKN